MTNLKTVSVDQLNRSLELSSKNPTSLKIKKNGKVYVTLDINDVKIKTPAHKVAKAIHDLSLKASDQNTINALKSCIRHYSQLGAQISQMMNDKKHSTKILYKMQGNSFHQRSNELYQQLEKKSQEGSPILSQIKEKGFTDVPGMLSVFINALKDSNTLEVDVIAAFALMNKNHPKEALALLQEIKEKGMEEPGTVSAELLNDLAYFVPKAHRKDYLNIEFPKAPPQEVEKPEEKSETDDVEKESKVDDKKTEPTLAPKTTSQSPSPTSPDFIDKTVKWAEENPAISIPLGVVGGVVAAPFVLAAGAVALLGAAMHPRATWDPGYIGYWLR